MELHPSPSRDLSGRSTFIVHLKRNEILNYVAKVAEFFKLRLGASLTDVYKMGSLAHAGFSQIYSDIDIGLLLNAPATPFRPIKDLGVIAGRGVRIGRWQDKTLRWTGLHRLLPTH